jgi:hypothetical protein
MPVFGSNNFSQNPSHNLNQSTSRCCFSLLVRISLFASHRPSPCWCHVCLVVPQNGHAFHLISSSRTGAAIATWADDVDFWLIPLSLRSVCISTLAFATTSLRDVIQCPFPIQPRARLFHERYESVPHASTSHELLYVSPKSYRLHEARRRCIGPLCSPGYEDRGPLYQAPAKPLLSPWDGDPERQSRANRAMTT